jgi:hypothetical protein
MTKKSKTVEKSKFDNPTMKIKVIACRVFEPELNHIFGSAPDGAGSFESGEQVSIDWLPLRAHDQPEVLKNDIQALIDAAEDFDAVVLAYGLCGNATAGLRAGNVPLYMPRAHDCSQILLGSGEAHRRFFGENPSRGWTSRGYMAAEDDPFRAGESVMGWELAPLIEQYGEENARYIWDTLHASDSVEDDILYYLDVKETSEPEILRLAVEKAELRGKKLETVPGTLDYLVRLLAGRGGDEILRVPPGAAIHPSWDENVVKTELELKK